MNVLNVKEGETYSKLPPAVSTNSVHTYYIIHTHKHTHTYIHTDREIRAISDKYIYLCIIQIR